MKKIVLACILLSGAYQLKAQQLQVKPADSLANNAIDRSVKLQTDSWKLLIPPLKGTETLALNTNKLNFPDLKTNNFRDNMSVVVLEGDSKMPVVKLDGNDNMPVKWISPVDQGILQQKTFQGTPAFKFPAMLSPAPQK
jgi:hypothetical protein